MTPLDEKILDNFPGKAARKDLTSLMKKGANVPTYVLEYLLGMYCATDDEDAIEVGLFSALANRSVMPSLVICGRVVMSGSMMPVTTELDEIIVAASNAGAGEKI